jgi:hypothetical protein
MIVLCALSTTANNLFFGFTRSGVTATINVARDLNLPVAVVNEPDATSRAITSVHECLGKGH